MKIQFKGLVRDVYVSDVDKEGKAKKNPVHYITFMDADTGGDVKFSFDPDHGLKPGSVMLDFDFVVKGRFFGNNIGYHVEKIVGKK